MPEPSDLKRIIKPESPRITEAEYIAALDYQKRNNWPAFSDAQMMIDRYREQQNEAREAAPKYDKKLLEIAAGSVKRIE